MLLLLSLLLPAMAGDAPTRCTTTLTMPDAEPMVIPGWGSSEVEARAAAWRTARLVAELRQVPVLWAPLWGWEAETEPAHQLLLDAPVDELGVPGATVAEGECAPWPVQGKGKGGWTSTWGEGPPVTRVEPAAAIEASRRLACTALWAEPQQQGFEEAAVVEPEVKDQTMFGAARKAWPTVAACFTGEPTLSPAPGKVRGPSKGQYACASWIFLGRAGWDGAPGWASTAEEAAEAAWQELTVARMRGGLAMAMEALAHASPEMKNTLVAVGMTQAMEVAPGVDAVQQGATTCQSLEGEPWVLSWTPARIEEAQDCAISQEEYPSSAQTGFPPQPERDRICDQEWVGVPLLREAVAHASPEMAPMLEASGWSIVLGCHASCIQHTRLQDPAGEDIVLPFAPDLSTKESAEAVLAAAVATRDIQQLQIILPLERRMLDRLAVDEEFWAAMADPTQREQILIWSEAPGGRWMLSPRPR